MLRFSEFMAFYLGGSQNKVLKEALQGFKKEHKEIIAFYVVEQLDQLIRDPSQEDAVRIYCIDCLKAMALKKEDLRR